MAANLGIVYSGWLFISFCEYHFAEDGSYLWYVAVEQYEQLFMRGDCVLRGKKLKQRTVWMLNGQVDDGWGSESSRRKTEWVSRDVYAKHTHRWKEEARYSWDNKETCGVANRGFIPTDDSKSGYFSLAVSVRCFFYLHSLVFAEC